jgi:hypothetical protein
MKDKNFSKLPSPAKALFAIVVESINALPLCIRPCNPDGLGLEQEGLFGKGLAHLLPISFRVP